MIFKKRGSFDAPGLAIRSIENAVEECETRSWPWAADPAQAKHGRFPSRADDLAFFDPSIPPLPRPSIAPPFSALPAVVYA